MSAAPAPATQTPPSRHVERHAQRGAADEAAGKARAELESVRGTAVGPRRVTDKAGRDRLG
ncbi:MAG: hypothetical protein WAV18_07340, partial [Roseiarcus sp.]